MSGLVKGVKKAFKTVTKVVKKVVKSKIFKVVAVAALAYFGGAAIMSMAGGGTASAGIGSAWGGIQGAGSAIASGNIGGAFSALGSGFTGGAAAGATGTFTAGQAAAQSAIAANATAATTAASTIAGSQTAIQASTPQLAAMHTGSTALATPLTTTAVTAPASGGLLAGLGEAGKAALVTGAINTGGQMLQGYSQQKQAEKDAENRNYFGVDGKGNNTQLPGVGLLNPANIMQQNPAIQLSTPKTIDELIARQTQQVNKYPTWGG